MKNKQVRAKIRRAMKLFKKIDDMSSWDCDSLNHRPEQYHAAHEPCKAKFTLEKACKELKKLLEEIYSDAE
jgi:hypothetical protein